MRRTLRACVFGATLPLMAIVGPPAHAGGGDVAAGVIGGLAAGALLGGAIAQPHYYGPPPVYVAPAPVYGPDCYWTRGEPYWDDYRGVWVSRRVRVCE